MEKNMRTQAVEGLERFSARERPAALAHERFWEAHKTLKKIFGAMSLVIVLPVVMCLAIIVIDGLFDMRLFQAVFESLNP